MAGCHTADAGAVLRKFEALVARGRWNREASELTRLMEELMQRLEAFLETDHADALATMCLLAGGGNDPTGYQPLASATDEVEDTMRSASAALWCLRMAESSIASVLRPVPRERGGR